MTADLTLFLRLTPEFGGTEFGPYDDVEILLGSDPDATRIYLRPELGILPQHVRIFRQGRDNLILAPSERTAGVYLFRGGANRPTQVTTPTAIQSGDQFALVSPGGPRFEVVLAPHPDRAARGTTAGPRNLKSRVPKWSAFTAEGRRQLFTMLLVTGPAQIAQRVLTFVRSGAIFMPRNIFLGLAIGGGWLFGGVQRCNNNKTKADLVVKNTRVENCERELTYAEKLTGGDSRDLSVAELVAVLSGSINLGQALESDDELRTMVKKKSKTAFANKQRFRWLTKGNSASAARFADWRERITSEESLDEDTRNLLVWLAGTPAKRNSDFSDTTDSEGDDVCVRGTVQMTYRQAISMGLNAQPDALVTKNYQATAEDKTKREKRLEATVAAAGTDLPEDNFETDVDPVSQGRAGCIYIQGEDERTSSSSLIGAFATHLGDSAALVPVAGDPMGAVARLAKYWAADLTRVDYREANGSISFEGSQVGDVLDGYDQRGAWVLERTADTIARSVVVPCLAALDKNKGDLGPIFGDRDPNDIGVNCLIFKHIIENP